MEAATAQKKVVSGTLFGLQAERHSPERRKMPMLLGLQQCKSLKKRSNKRVRESEYGASASHGFQTFFMAFAASYTGMCNYYDSALLNKCFYGTNYDFSAAHIYTRSKKKHTKRLNRPLP